METATRYRQVTPAAGSSPASSKNPKRVAAGRSNRQKRQGLTPEGRERLRQAALQNKPWRFSTGPRTAAGKAKTAASNRRRQLGPLSVRQLRAQLADLKALACAMQACRHVVGDLEGASG